MKKGFTLIELLGIMTILGILALLIIPSVQSALSDSREKLFQNQIDSIEKIARSWGTTNIDKVDSCYILTIDELKKSGLLENVDIINPKTKEELDGCVKVVYESSINQYTYDYTEQSSCSCN